MPRPPCGACKKEGVKGTMYLVKGKWVCEPCYESAKPPVKAV